MHRNDSRWVPPPSTVQVNDDRIGALIDRAAAADDGFREHARNVADLSVRVARELGITNGRLDVLEFAAAVHDVGKLCVSAEIIAKPGALDEREWEEMRRHPLAGAELLEPAGAPPEVLEIVRCHHERWDGAGYPGGLGRTKIPLGARIISVADAYCAMVETRPYRAPMRPFAARAELLAQGGKQFDAACAQAAYRVTAPVP